MSINPNYLRGFDAPPSAPTGFGNPYFDTQDSFDPFMFDRMENMPDISKTIFVGDLSYFCNEEDLCALFSPYGRIITVRVRRGVTGESLMHGFIALESPEAAQRAIGDLDGIEFMGRNMRVQRSSDSQRPSSAIKESYVQVHVSFISKQIHTLISEKVLRELFGPFGSIADVAIKKHTMIQKQNRQSGYGFVYFTNPEAAYRAMNAFKHHTIRDITFDCSISHKSEHLIRGGRSNNDPIQSRRSEMGMMGERNMNRNVPNDYLALRDPSFQHPAASVGNTRYPADFGRSHSSYPPNGFNNEPRGLPYGMNPQSYQNQHLKRPNSMNNIYQNPMDNNDFRQTLPLNHSNLELNNSRSTMFNSDYHPNTNYLQNNLPVDHRGLNQNLGLNENYQLSPKLSPKLSPDNGPMTSFFSGNDRYLSSAFPKEEGLFGREISPKFNASSFPPAPPASHLPMSVLPSNASLVSSNGSNWNFADDLPKEVFLSNLSLNSYRNENYESSPATTSPTLSSSNSLKNSQAPLSEVSFSSLDSKIIF